MMGVLGEWLLLESLAENGDATKHPAGGQCSSHHVQTGRDVRSAEVEEPDLHSPDSVANDGGV